MAREYGRVHTAFWNSPAMRSLGDKGKLLANYLLTGPHSNSIGAYLLPDAYIADDLGWDAKTVSAQLKLVIATGFCERFADGRHIAVCKYLEWNPIENPNVGKAAIRQLEQLPVDPATQHVVNGIDEATERLPNHFGTVPERYRNTKPCTKPETKPNPETKPEMELAGSADADAIPQAFSAYNQLAIEADWPEAKQITGKRAAAMRKRLSEIGGLDGWLTAMSKARGSPWLRGETKRGKGYENWTPDIDFFLQQSSLTKLMEGKYDQRNSNQQPDGFDALAAGASRAAGLDGRSGQGVESAGSQPGRLALPSNG